MRLDLHAARWLSLCLAALAGLCLPPAGAADRGYLSTVGPPPLRFTVTLPPPPEAVASNPPPSISPAAVLNRSAAPAPLLPPTAPPTVETTRLPAVTAPEVSSPEFYGPPPPPALSPAIAAQPPGTPLDFSPGTAPSTSQTMLPQAQLFLQYFTPDYLPGSNGYGISVPVGFVPPQPRPVSSSSATYQVVPGGTGTAPPAAR